MSVSADANSPIALSLNNANELIISIGQDSEITIPQTISDDIVASGNDDIASYLEDSTPGSQGSYGQSASKTGMLWGQLSSKFEDDINPVGNWQPGSAIQFKGQSIRTINDSISNIQLKIEEAGMSPAELNSSLVEFAASEGFLDDGVIYEHEASDIAKFLESNEFESKLDTLNSDAPTDIINQEDEDDGKNKDKHDFDALIPKTGLKPEPEPEPEQKQAPLPEKTEMQKLFSENREIFKTIGSKWQDWATEKGGDNIVSIADLKKIAKNEDGSKTKEEQKAAQFLIDHPKITDSMDISQKGGEKDTKISVNDLGVWMKNENLFGPHFTAENAEALTNLSTNWKAISRGDDQISKDDIDYVLSNPKDKSGKPEFNEQQINGAQFLKDNPDYYAFLDLYGSGLKHGFRDGKVGFKDFSQISDGLISANFKQFSEGNCWALTGLYSMARTEDGSRAISNSIRQGEDGNYYVTFAGDPNHKEYKVTPDDIKNSGFAQEGSDIDMQVMNLAIDQFSREIPGDETIRKGDNGEYLVTFANDPAHKEYVITEEVLKNANIDESKDNLNEVVRSIALSGFKNENPEYKNLPIGGSIGKGGHMDNLYRLLTGNGDRIFNDREKGMDLLIQNADRINSRELSISVGGEVGSDGNLASGTGSSHAFTIVNVDPKTETIQYVNPWNGTEVKEISFGKFKELYDSPNVGARPGINYVEYTK